MSRRKKKRSIYIDRAHIRALSLRSVDPTMDFGGGLTLQAFEGLILRTRQLLDEYNALLSDLDRVHDAFKIHERAMNNMTARMLTGVATRYGKESVEYEMAGGSRRSSPQLILPSATNPSPTTPPTDPAPAMG